MKRMLLLLVVVLVLLVPVGAVEEESLDNYVPYTYQEVYALPDNTRIITADDVEPTDVEISAQALDPVTPSNANGLKAVLLDVLGDYSAIVVEYRYTNTNGTYSYTREIQPDYVWMASAGMFALLIWCTFKLGGAFLSKR